MIEIQITDSPDIDSKGIHHFKLNKITMGAKKNNNLVIFDPSLKRKEFLLVIKNNHCILRSYNSPFFINNMKYEGVRALKVNEIFTIGKTSVKLINFSKEEMLPSSLAEYISQQKDILQKEDSLRYDLIEEIELELLDLEN